MSNSRSRYDRPDIENRLCRTHNASPQTAGLQAHDLLPGQEEFPSTAHWVFRCFISFAPQVIRTRKITIVFSQGERKSPQDAERKRIYREGWAGIPAPGGQPEVPFNAEPSVCDDANLLGGTNLSENPVKT